MDHHDLERRPFGPEPAESWSVDDGPWSGRARLSAATLAIGIDTDELFFHRHSQEIVDTVRAQGGTAELAMLTSLHGHDAFLIEWAQLDPLLRRALDLPRK